MRLGIVNDMALAREALRRVVTSVPGYVVAWAAADGAEAHAFTRDDRPDLILMDLIMPGVDGTEATRRIMADAPCPILIVTSSVSGNIGKVYDAMGHGALDAVDTPCLGPGGQVAGGATLLQKIATIEKLLGMVPNRNDGTLAVVSRPRAACADPLVAIGSSTGGPNALVEVLSGLNLDLDVPVVIIQHVDAAFATGLARWLGERTGHRVEIARQGDRPEPGRVLVAGTDDHLVLGPDLRLGYEREPKELPYRPSVDVFLASAMEHWPTPGVAVLLTGMGRDGAAAMLAMRREGWVTIAQDQATSVIWGMPRAAVEIGAAARVLPVSAIGKAVMSEVRKRKRNESVTP